MNLNENAYKNNFVNLAPVEVINPATGEIFNATPIAIEQAEELMPGFLKDYKYVWNTIHDNYSAIFKNSDKLPIPAIIICNQADLERLANDVSLEQLEEGSGIKGQRLLNFSVDENAIYVSMEFFSSLKDESESLERLVILAEEVIHAFSARKNKVGFADISPERDDSRFIKTGFYKFNSTDKKIAPQENFKKESAELYNPKTLFATENISKLLAWITLNPNGFLGIDKYLGGTEETTLLINIKNLNELFKSLPTSGNLKGNLAVRLAKLLNEGNTDLIDDVIFNPLLNTENKNISKALVNFENLQVAIFSMSKSIVSEDLMFVDRKPNKS